MALKPCRECGAQVSTEAKTCPHCGVGNPTAKPPMRTTGAGWLIVIAAIGGVIYWVSSSSGSDSGKAVPAAASMSASAALSSSTIGALAAASSSPARVVAPPPTATCATDYTVCKDNADLVNNYDKIIDAQSACRSTTDASVKYGNPDWPWLPFGSYFPGNTYVKAGVVRLAEDKVQIQNGFGAMVHSQVICDYDLKAKKVVMLSINGDPQMFGDDALLDLPPDDASSGAAIDAAPPMSAESGPSFSCTRAFYPDEKAICANPTLSALDHQTDKLFEKAADASADPSAFRKANVKYVIERRTCGDSVACITAWYMQRQAALRKDLAGPSQ